MRTATKHQGVLWLKNSVPKRDYRAGLEARPGFSDLAHLGLNLNIKIIRGLITSCVSSRNGQHLDHQDFGSSLWVGISVRGQGGKPLNCQYPHPQDCPDYPAEPL